MTKDQLVPVQADEQAIGQIISVDDKELKFNIKSSKPLEDLLKTFKQEDLKEFDQQPIPLEEEFVQKVEAEIGRRDTAFAKNLRKLITEPLDIDEKPRLFSVVDGKPNPKSSLTNIPAAFMNSLGTNGIDVNSTGFFGDDHVATVVSEGPENSFGYLVARTMSAHHPRGSYNNDNTPYFLAKQKFAQRQARDSYLSERRATDASGRTETLKSAITVKLCFLGEKMVGKTAMILTLSDEDDLQPMRGAAGKT